MSTIWGGICLDHNPPIEFEMSDGSYEIKSHERAFQVFRTRDGEDHGHGRCDVVLGGYSYPLVAVTCPCRKRADHAPPFWAVEDLRCVLALSRLGDTITVGEWLRHNSCWTVKRLEKLAPLFMPKVERQGNIRALLESNGWALARITQTLEDGAPFYDLRVYPRNTNATKDEGTTGS